MSISVIPPLVERTVFTESGTWPKPGWARFVRVILFGGGGGGGSGRRGAAGSLRCGGIGGSGSVPVEHVFLASELTDTVAVTIGNGGSAGAAVTTDDTNGANGGTGGNTFFGGYLRGRGAARGIGGTAAAQIALDVTRNANGRAMASDHPGQAYTHNLATSWDGRGGCPGGSAGGLSTGNAIFYGERGCYPYGDPALTENSAGGLAGDTDGEAGAAGTDSALIGFGGIGGGSGASSVAGPAGAGGAGGRGAGGGGGGASVNGQSSGAGGAGGAGLAIIIAYS